MVHRISLSPVEVDEELCAELEQRGLIVRLGPGRHTVAASPGRTADRVLHDGADKHGPHRLLAVTVNRSRPVFEVHPDDEVFWLVGDPAARRLVVTIALCSVHELGRRAGSGELSAANFACLRMRPNDPLTGFFVLRAGVPHAEVAEPGGGAAPSFYVTEGRDLSVEFLELAPFEVEIDWSAKRFAPPAKKGST